MGAATLKFHTNRDSLRCAELVGILPMTALLPATCGNKVTSTAQSLEFYADAS